MGLRVEVNIRASTARRGRVDKEVSREHVDILCGPYPISLSSEIHRFFFIFKKSVIVSLPWQLAL
jgi:hypothetical protein